jgi:predicted RND superfamily exporter protein
MTRSRAARLLTRLAIDHAVLVLVCSLLVTAAGAVLASRLRLETDLAELLPPRAPSVTALHALAARVGGTGNVAIAIESMDGTPGPLRRYMPRLAQALRAQLGADLLSIRYSRKEVTDYYKRFAAYYVALDQLEAWSQRLAVALAKQNPVYVELDDAAGDPLRELARDVRATRDRLGPKQTADPETGLLMTEGGRLGVMFVRPASDSLNLGGADGMMSRIRGIVESTHPAEQGVAIAGYTGSIPVALTEVAAIRNDIVSTAIFVILGVGAVVMLYFRGLRELMLISGAVIFGTAVALGFAELWIGHVNAQTAFLGAIIVGTGINYGIIFLDRYRQVRAREPSFEDALEEACDQTLRATAIAALSTAVSFGTLAAGEIESFAQFGWIGGIGILASWIGTFTIVPACVVLADRRRAPRPHHVPLAGAFSWLGVRSERGARAFVAASLVIAAASAAIAVDARHDVIETDIRKLGTRSSETGGIQELDNRLRSMDDRSSTPAVIATDSRAETRPVCDVLNERAQHDLRGILRRCYSLDDLFPRDLERRREVIERLRHQIASLDEEDLDPADRADFAELRRALAERPPETADLPPSLREYFVERDGSVGKLAYVEPNNEHIEHNLYAFTDAMRSVRLPSGKVIESSGDLVVFADVLRAMRRDATKLTIAAVVLVLLILGIATRRLPAFARVGGVMIAAVVIMMGAAVLLGEKLNFFNFVALPTTFGVGIDYAINVEERLRQRGRGALAAALGEAGPAVVLASLTSMIGYASLLVADSRALASFGSLAIIGEISCVVLAITLLPALWGLGRRAGGASAARS